MTNAKPVDLVGLMSGLAVRRPVFGSEADFQLALAWEFQHGQPDAIVRLEYRPAYLDRRGYLDVWVDARAWKLALELKYFTRALSVNVGDERFELLNHGAQDVSRYDFVRDIERVESVVRGQPGVAGAVIALTNDSSYWRPPKDTRLTIDSAFRIHEGATLGGDLAWGEGAGPGTTRGRERVHSLAGRYKVEWHDYSSVAEGPAGKLRYAVVRVP
jgi:hypothetical protein